MAILEITMGTTGLAGVEPRVIYINTNDTLATVTTLGYLNKAKQQGFAFQESDMACVSTKPTPNSPVTEVAWLEVSIVGVNTSLVPTGSPGQVVLPTIVNALAHATNLTGTLSTAAANVFNLGNISAGQSGTAGSFIAFPAAAANGFLQLLATANGGARNAIITNNALAQTTAFFIPDPGIAATNFLLTNNAGTQTIATGSLTLTLGNLLVTAGTIAGGTTITAGINNVSAGSFVAIPAGNNQGSFRFVANPIAGNFIASILNRNIGQTTVYSLPDAANATASILVAATATPFTTNHIMVANGTGGLIADAGYQMKTVAGAAAAGGAAAQTFVDAFCTAASNVVGNWNTQANPVSVLKIVPGVGSFVVTSSADAGVGTFNYIITKV